MDDPIHFDSIDVSISGNVKPRPVRPDEKTPFRILIMGDFSGRANRGCETDGADIAGRRLYRVDRDTDDTVMAKMGPALSIPAAGPASPPVDLTFAELDDFHPDSIYQRELLFKTLRTTRRRLMDPATFAKTAAAISVKDRPASDESPSQPTPATPIPAPAGSGLLDQILDAGTVLPEKAPESGSISDWDRFLDQVVGPYLVPDIEKEQEKMVAGVDRAIAGMMNAILHHPDFQNLEARWRGLRWIVRRLETGEQLQIDLLDLTRAEFSASLTGNDDLADTSIYKKLATAGAAEGGQAPWSLMLGLYDFAKTRADAVILARAGALGQALNAAFVAAADGSVIHCRNLAETPDPADWTAAATGPDERAWQVMRGLSEAAWVGLAMPRFLIRLPYGADTDPVDAFDFEEMPETPIHENYLWAHPAFAVALVMGRSFVQSGWHFMHHLQNHIADLPLHVYTSDGERTLAPCCEVPLGERALQQMIASGVLPLIGLQGRDQAVLPRLRSLAVSDTPLAGRW